MKHLKTIGIVAACIIALTSLATSIFAHSEIANLRSAQEEMPLMIERVSEDVNKVRYDIASLILLSEETEDKFEATFNHDIGIRTEFSYEWVSYEVTAMVTTNIKDPVLIVGEMIRTKDAQAYGDPRTEFTLVLENGGGRYLHYDGAPGTATERPEYKVRIKGYIILDKDGE